MQKPTLEEIQNFLTDEKHYDDFTAQGFATQFWHFYESKGWKVGRNPMVSWKSAIVTWEVKNRQNGINRQTPGKAAPQGTSDARIERAKNWGGNF